MHEDNGRRRPLRYLAAIVFVVVVAPAVVEEGLGPLKSSYGPSSDVAPLPYSAASCPR